MIRLTEMPHTCAGPGAKRTLLNGMVMSTAYPSSVIRPSVYQSVSKLKSNPWPSVVMPSSCTPNGFAAKT